MNLPAMGMGIQAAVSDRLRHNGAARLQSLCMPLKGGSFTGGCGGAGSQDACVPLLSTGTAQQRPENAMAAASVQCRLPQGGIWLVYDS